ncbi:GNAT family N-acetyltransferase [Frigoribacterium faeni]|uniref:GNAT family N-acetyltransferase n=1 Tax=Frigoribacterium faeni TaxID=145483 RepID=UPI001FADE266|nr:GNAT family N-acetyltransferase [Frigoribacterium faeni]MCJ0699804.1 GNAT family N-acetyltransferase [Frigoribacterium faeni]
MQPFVLESDAVRLAVPERADVAAIVDACRDPELQRFTTVPVPYDESDAEFFLRRIVDHGWSTGRECTWGLRSPGSSLLVGMISLRFADDDIGFWTSPAHRGRGLMTAAVALVADWAFAHGGVDELYWEGFVDNDGSAGVARSTGFRYTGDAPGLHPARDGSHPLCRTARLRSSDDRSVKPGWPVGISPSEYSRDPAVDIRGLDEPIGETEPERP